jgi:hypothetical protein
VVSVRQTRPQLMRQSLSGWDSKRRPLTSRILLAAGGSEEDQRAIFQLLASWLDSYSLADEADDERVQAGHGRLYSRPLSKPNAGTGNRRRRAGTNPTSRSRSPACDLRLLSPRRYLALAALDAAGSPAAQ